MIDLGSLDRDEYEQIRIKDVIQILQSGQMEVFLPEAFRGSNVEWSWLITWVCPGCGEKVSSNYPNTINTEGYEHTFNSNDAWCGHVYRGDFCGVNVAVGVAPEQLETMLQFTEADL